MRVGPGDKLSRERAKSSTTVADTAIAHELVARIAEVIAYHTWGGVTASRGRATILLLDREL